MLGSVSGHSELAIPSSVPNLGKARLKTSPIWWPGNGLRFGGQEMAADLVARKRPPKLDWPIKPRISEPEKWSQIRGLKMCSNLAAMAEWLETGRQIGDGSGRKISWSLVGGHR